MKGFILGTLIYLNPVAGDKIVEVKDFKDLQTCHSQMAQVLAQAYAHELEKNEEMRLWGAMVHSKARKYITFRCSPGADA
jgi:hypothetical protein